MKEDYIIVSKIIAEIVARNNKNFGLDFGEYVGCTYSNEGMGFIDLNFNKGLRYRIEISKYRDYFINANNLINSPVWILEGSVPEKIE